jgi:hypothetical protein
LSLSNTEYVPKGTWLREPAETALINPPPSAPVGWPNSLRTWLLGTAADGGPDLWVTQVGLDAHRGIDWAMGSVQAYLGAALKRSRSSTHRPTGARALPLLTLHLVASGKKNAPHSLGELSHRLLDVLAAFVATNPADVAVVVRDVTEYAALQAARLRRASSWSELPATAATTADRLAEEAVRGGLCVLTGAGISVGAGLPTWTQLLQGLADGAAIPVKICEEIFKESDPLRQASAILDHYDGDRRAFNEAIAERCKAPRIALTHALLAISPFAST